MPLGTRLTDLLHELLNKCPNPTGNQEFIFCHDPCGPASREILRGISKAGGEQNKPRIGRGCANLATGFSAADPWHPQVHEDDLGAQLATHLHGGLTRRRFGNLALTLVQEVASKGSTERGAIVHDQYAGGGSICTSHRASLGADPFSMGCRRKSWCPVRRATRCSANHRCHSSVRTYFSTPVPVLEFGRNHARCRGP